MSRTRTLSFGWKCGLLAVLAIATIAVAGFALVRVPENVTASAPQPVPAIAATPTVEPERDPIMAVIGDSYSAGAGNSVRWTNLVAQEHGMILANRAVGRTGYTVGTIPFASQAAGILSGNANVIIIAGSRNDSGRPGDVEAAAAETYRAIKEAHPAAKIIVIGPMWDSSQPSSGAAAANEATRRAASAAGLPFIDALTANWLDDPALIQADGIHPTDAGQKDLAAHISRELSKLGV